MINTLMHTFAQNTTFITKTVCFKILESQLQVEWSFLNSNFRAAKTVKKIIYSMEITRNYMSKKNQNSYLFSFCVQTLSKIEITPFVFPLRLRQF